ncbi:MAG: biopolymer transporter ExbD [Ketobacteraceae bacterium]|nr:biopolymer transporter ExbD [Ketobacteraceae bacterium]
MFIKRQPIKEADLDITAFMNLMIVLVPVLLMSMVFNHITILQLNLPDLTGAEIQSAEKNRQLEVVLREDRIEVFYPSGVLVKTIPSVEKGEKMVQDYHTLSLVLQEIKRTEQSANNDKRDVLLLSEAGVDYQELVSTMDTLRAFETVVVTSKVEVELFPEISLGDAPIVSKKG